MPRDDSLVRITEFWKSMNITYQRGSELISWYIVCRALLITLRWLRHNQVLNLSSS
jgi:hypothetical protein